MSVNLRITVSWLKTEKDAELTGDHGEKKEEIMENFINNAPFALVLVALVIGFVLLIKGADYFVEGSSSVAKRLHVPAIIIGLTIVAMGTGFLRLPILT